MSKASPPTVLIAGASRGLGFGLTRELLVRGWRVIATERTAGGSQALKDLAEFNSGRLVLEVLDIADATSIVALGERLSDQRLDWLFVNAGVSDAPDQTVGQISDAEFAHVMATNALGPMRVIDRFQALVVPKGLIAVMSSALGSVSLDPPLGYEVYSASKAALNRLMRSYAVRAGGERTLLAMMPGWVRTDMGGLDAPVDVPTSAEGLADTLAARAGQPGLAFVDYQNNPIPW